MTQCKVPTKEEIYGEPSSKKCSGCESFDMVATIPWRMCRHPERYELARVKETCYDTGGLKSTDEEVVDLMWATSFGLNPPEELVDKGCPFENLSMFKTILGNNKTAEVEFRDQEKFRSIPSLALPAICFLDEYLTKDMEVFEWGSGASTLFFAMRCDEQSSVCSIEHSKEWYRKVSIALKYRGFDFASRSPDYYLKEPDEGFDEHFASSQPGYDSVNFKSYVTCIDALSDMSQDVILVDGRARNACLKAAQPKLKSGGILILDDSARTIYQQAMSEIDWPVFHFEGCIPFYKHGHTVRTTIWIKE